MPAIDRRLLTHFEWLLPLLVLAATTTGIFTIYSATWTPATVGPPALAMRQLAWLGAGMHADMHWLERTADKRLDPGLVLPGAP